MPQDKFCHEKTIEEEVSYSIKKLQEQLKKLNSRLVIEVSAEKIILTNL